MTLITTAFEVAGRARARILGIEEHPLVVLEHPLASKTRAQVKEMTSRIVRQIANGLSAKT